MGEIKSCTKDTQNLQRYREVLPAIARLLYCSVETDVVGLMKIVSDGTTSLHLSAVDDSYCHWTYRHRQKRNCHFRI